MASYACIVIIFYDISQGSRSLRNSGTCTVLAKCGILLQSGIPTTAV